MDAGRADLTLEEARVQKDCWSGKAFDMWIFYQMPLAKVQNHNWEGRGGRFGLGAGWVFWGGLSCWIKVCGYKLATEADPAASPKGPAGSLSSTEGDFFGCFPSGQWLQKVLEVVWEKQHAADCAVSKFSQISFLPNSLGERLCNQTRLHVKTHLCTSRHAGYCQSGQTVLPGPARKVVFCPAEKKTSFSLCTLEFVFSDSDLISRVSLTMTSLAISSQDHGPVNWALQQ